jgi:hypothetical protein
MTRTFVRRLDYIPPGAQLSAAKSFLAYLGILATSDFIYPNPMIDECLSLLYPSYPSAAAASWENGMRTTC